MRCVEEENENIKEDRSKNTCILRRRINLVMLRGEDKINNVSKKKYLGYGQDGWKKLIMKIGELIKMFQFLEAKWFLSRIPISAWHDDREERQRTENSIKQLNHRAVINFFFSSTFPFSSVLMKLKIT